jgi:hypothetical protein
MMGRSVLLVVVGVMEGLKGVVGKAEVDMGVSWSELSLEIEGLV